MKLHSLALSALLAILPLQNEAFQPQLPQITPSLQSSTALNGKLWDKLEIEPDTEEDEPAWYLMNCVAGSEMALLAQAKHVTRAIDTSLIEKIVVPTERHLRSHGAKHNVVEVRVSYPGYVFCKMRICADTYEPLQELPLCRSWMAGTVNLKGYKKLPPAPIALPDEEVAKFKGLEEKTEAMYKEFGEDYTGKGDAGLDLIQQYEGYKVESMVKVLEGNFKGEDGIVRRLKDGEVMVRMYTYGSVLDYWFKPSDIRPMTDIEAMKGLTGPNQPVMQDDFDVSIGKPPKSREGREGSNFGGGGRGDRNRRQDRMSRGERGNRDIHGRTEQEQKEEEDNWRTFREEQRAEQQQKRGDQWGLKERTAWSGGDDNVISSSSGYKSAREERREKQRNTAKNVENAISGEGEWDLFADSSSSSPQVDEGSSKEDDFFNSLMNELSDNLDEQKNTKNKVYSSFMSELSDSLEDDENEQNEPKNSKSPKPPSPDEDDFFASLEADLNEPLEVKSKSQDNSGDDDFFSNLESELGDMLSDSASEPKSQDNSEENDFFSNLESELGDALLDSPAEPKSQDNSEEDDFFSNLESELGDALLDSPAESKTKDVSEEDDFFSNLESEPGATLSDKSSDSKDDDGFFDSKVEQLEAKLEGNAKKMTSTTNDDLNKFSVKDLKEMLRAKGLKVSGRKSELIERLGQQ